MENVQRFPIVPAQVSGWWIWAPAILFVTILLGVGWLLVRSATGARQSSFEVSSQGLVIRGDIYGRTIPLSSLKPADARPVDLDRDRDLAPKWRRAGTAIPGYRSGWFSLQNGEKALLYVTDPHRVAYLPTTEGFSILLSVEQPDQLIEAVRRAARN